MITIIEGPDKSGKSYLIKRILEGFEEDRAYQKVFSDPDALDGFGYMAEFDEHLQSPIVSLWHRSWVSEAIYGKLLGQPRSLAEDEFLGEWFYSRVLNGRGGNFILLPSNPAELARRRDDSDFEENTLSSIDEYNAYKRYAERWGYNVLLNDYEEDEQFLANVRRVRAASWGFPHILKIPDDEYVGSPRPIATFVGQFLSDVPALRPFNSKIAARYFKPFGQLAIKRFGYATINGYEENLKRFPHLFYHTFTVGGAARLAFPKLPNLEAVSRTPRPEEVSQFKHQFHRLGDLNYPSMR